MINVALFFQMWCVVFTECILFSAAAMEVPMSSTVDRSISSSSSSSSGTSNTKRSKRGNKVNSSGHKSLDFDNLIVIYNRVPKTGSTSFIGLAYDLCNKNKFSVLNVNTTKKNPTLSLTDQVRNCL